MKFLSYFQSIGFTRNETKVILMLGATFLLGLGIRYYNSSPATGITKQFDYSMADSIFQARSTAPAQDASTTPNSDNSPGKRSAYVRKAALGAGDHVNINTASADRLILLPGIGPAYAERIISYRKENGPFTSVDELENVKGIGKKKLARLRPFVRVN